MLVTVNGIRISDLTEPTRERLRALVAELQLNRQSSELLEQREKEIKAELLTQMLEFGPGSRIVDEERAVQLYLSTRATKTISREKLLEQGVAPSVIAAAPEERHSVPWPGGHGAESNPLRRGPPGRRLA